MQTLRSGKAVPDICVAAELSDDALTTLAGAPEARGFVERLVLDEAWEDAIAFLAHAFPRREGVWWAWTCAREAAGEKPKPAVSACLEATKAWIAEPIDPNGRGALDAAQVLGIATPAGMAGLAAFLCSDSLAPTNAPVTPAPEFAAAKAIVGCVNLAAAPDPKAGSPPRHADLVKRGLELADRIKLWTPEPGATAGR